MMSDSRYVKGGVGDLLVDKGISVFLMYGFKLLLLLVISERALVYGRISS